MKAMLLAGLLFLAATPLMAGESEMVRAFQPALYESEDSPITIAPVTGFLWNAQVGWFTKINLITAKNIPPTDSPSHVRDINAASVCGLVIYADEMNPGKVRIVVDCSKLDMTKANGFSDKQLVGATLECLRRMLQDHAEDHRNDTITIEGKYKASSQESLKAVIEAFKKSPQDKEFSWR